MLVTTIFIAGCIALGWGVARRIGFLDDAHKRLAFATGFGILVGSWLAFLFGWAAGRLTEISVLAAAAVLAAGAWHLLKNCKETKPRQHDRFGLAFVAAICIVLMLINNATVLEASKQGGWTAAGNVWADYPLHLSIIYSFSERSNFPPMYPLLLNAPMGYPFLADFLSAVLMKGGLDVRNAILLPHLLLYFVLASFGYFLAREITKSNAAGAIAVTLFLFNGNTGIINAAKDAMDSNNALNFLSHLPGTYSNIPDQAIVFANLIFAVFIPQRSAIMGFSLLLLFFYMLYRMLERHGKAEMLAAGAILGLLPLAHGHSFIVAAIAAACFGAYRLFKAKDKAAEFALLFWFALPALVFALPQVYWISQQVKQPAFLTQQWGWLERNKAMGVPELFLFWLANTGIILPLALVGLGLASNKARMLYVPALLAFIVGHLVKFQPWEYDNIKLFLPWFFFTCIFAAIPVAMLWQDKKKTFKAAAIALVLVATASGVLTLAWWWNDDPGLYSREELQAAQWIRQNTEPEAVWITSDAHNGIVYTIAGRRVISGLHIFANNHGLNYDPAAADVTRFYATGDCAIANKYGAKYLYLSPQEISLEKARRETFSNNPHFQKVTEFQYPWGEAEVYRINC
ncbi:MAG: hypothetical protein V1708_05155 [Candidatus Micrarchaeota archaeon]